MVTNQPANYWAFIGRAAGIAALADLAIFLYAVFGLGFGPNQPGSVLYGSDHQAAASFAAAHTGTINTLGFTDGMLNTVFAVLIVLLIALTGSNGVLARIAYISAGVACAVQWVHAGMLYALAQLAPQTGVGEGVSALATLANTMNGSDALIAPLAILCAGLLMVRSSRVPAFLGWLTVVIAGLGIVGSLVVALGGPDQPFTGVILPWVWFIGLGITLLIKPVWGARRTEMAAATA